MATYENQAFLPCKIRPDGAGADVSIKTLDAKFTEKGTGLEKKLAGNNGIPERYPGFIDFECEMTFLVDSSALPSASAGLNLRFGSKQTVRFPVATTTGAPSNWFSFHSMCMEAAYEIPNDDILKITAKFAVDASSNAQGGSSPITYPT